LGRHLAKALDGW